MKFRLDTSQMAGVQCECAAWDLVEDLAICVSSSWRSWSLNKNDKLYVSKVTVQEHWVIL